MNILEMGLMKFFIKDKIVFINAKITVVDSTRVQVGLNSGFSKKGNHFIFLDYDNLLSLDDLVREFTKILVDNNLRRGIIVESSKGKYHALSFSPTPYSKMLGISSTSSCDSRHKSCTINNGFATLRFTKKGNFKIRVVKEIDNKKGTNFYSYEHENIYKERLINSG